MSYSALSDIAAEFKSVSFTSTTAVTDTQVNAFIAQADALINARVGLRYQTPVTDTEALLILQSISTAIVAERIRPILATKSGETEKSQATRGTSNPTVPASPWKLLDAIVAGQMKFGLAALISSVDGVQSDNTNDPTTNAFVIDPNSQQW